MNVTHEAAKKILEIFAPATSINEGTHSAKIIDENFITKLVKVKKTGEEMQIISMKVCIDGHPSFNATCLDYKSHLSKKVNDIVQVRVFVKDGYRNAEV